MRELAPLLVDAVLPALSGGDCCAALADQAEILDAACGDGCPAFELASALGPRARVTGVDMDADGIGACAQAARARRTSNVEFQQCSIASLPAEWAGRFDAATCLNGLQYARETPRVLRELRRVLRPAGLLALLVWASPEETPLLSLPIRAAAAVSAAAARGAAPTAHPPPPRARAPARAPTPPAAAAGSSSAAGADTDADAAAGDNAGDPFRFGSAERLDQLVGSLLPAAGFDMAGATTGSGAAEVAFESVDAYWQWCVGACPSLLGAGAAVRAELEASVAERNQGTAGTGGTVTMAAGFHLIVCRSSKSSSTSASDVTEDDVATGSDHCGNTEQSAVAHNRAPPSPPSPRQQPRQKRRKL